MSASCRRVAFKVLSAVQQAGGCSYEAERERRVGSNACSGKCQYHGKIMSLVRWRVYGHVMWHVYVFVWAGTLVLGCVYVWVKRSLRRRANGERTACVRPVK